MIIARPPSLQREYDDFWSGDPAIIPSPDGEPDYSVWRDRIARARETGDWTDVLVAGETPTKFTLRPITAHQFALLVDYANGHAAALVNELAFRLAFVRVSNLGANADLEYEAHPEFGKLCTTSFLDKAGVTAAVALLIIQEIGGAALTRASQLPPKR